MKLDSPVICRLMRSQDRAALLALWKRVFGDNSTYAGRCLDAFAGAENVLVAGAESGELAAMLLMVPCRLGDAKGCYLYALATEPDFRGCGMMSALMEESDRLVLERGGVFSVLIPASRTLYGYYQKRGYHKMLWLRHLRIAVTAKSASAMPMGRFPPSGKLFAELRERWMDVPYIDFAGNRRDLIGQELEADGAKIAQCSAGYAVYQKRENTLLVAEIGAENDNIALIMMQTLAWEEGADAIEATLPGHSHILEGAGVRKPTALAKILTPSYHFDDAVYLRFAMDTPFVFDLPDS